MEGNSRRQPQDIEDKDEAFYQRHDFSGVYNCVKLREKLE
jgi:hypothetical protein